MEKDWIGSLLGPWSQGLTLASVLFRLVLCLTLSAIIPYRWAFIISVGLGASMKLDLVWTLSDIFNALMAFPNLIGLIMLTPVVKAETLAYLRSLKKEPASEG